jgi:hypothetical protein
MPRHSDGKAFGLGALSAGAVISVVAGAYKFGEAALHLRKLHSVGKENDVFVRMVERVRLDLAEVDRLLAVPEVKLALSQSPEKAQWIKRTITTLRMAMEEKARWTESVRKGIEGGRFLGLRKRIWWVLEEHEKLVNRRMELAMCHLGLLQVLAFLSPLEPLACCQPEGMYRANEKFYKEADEMIRYHDIPERRESFGRNEYSERRFEDVRETSRARGVVDEDVSGQHSQGIIAHFFQYTPTRQYETVEGDRIVEDKREFSDSEREGIYIDRKVERDYRDSGERDVFVDRRVEREYQDGGERKEVFIRRTEERDYRDDEREHDRHRHQHHHSHHSRRHERDSDEEDDIIIKRRVIRHSGSRL